MMTGTVRAGDLPYRPCAGVVLINKDALIFAGQRIDWAGAWQMPQGGIDKGETPEQAALRELTEETGVSADRVEPVTVASDWLYYDLPPELLGTAWKGKYRGQKQKWFLFRFLGDDSDIDIRTEHPEFDQWCWMRADDLITHIVPFKREVYRQVFRAFREHLAGGDAV